MYSMWSQPQSNYTATVTAPVQVTSALPLVSPVPDKALYPVYPAEGDNIGSLTIPALKQKFPILQGTGDVELKKGVGHFMLINLRGVQESAKAFVLPTYSFIVGILVLILWGVFQSFTHQAPIIPAASLARQWDFTVLFILLRAFAFFRRIRNVIGHSRRTCPF